MQIKVLHLGKAEMKEGGKTRGGCDVIQVGEEGEECKDRRM